jgi:hypothetical protein
VHLSEKEHSLYRGVFLWGEPHADIVQVTKPIGDLLAVMTLPQPWSPEVIPRYQSN